MIDKIFLEGHGILCSKNFLRKIDVYFDISYASLYLTMNIVGRFIALPGEIYSFEGITSKEELIFCDNVCCISQNKKRTFSFQLLSPLQIGKINSPIAFKAEIFGLARHNFAFDFDDKNISFEVFENFDELMESNKYFGCQRENGVLKIKNKNKKEIDEKEIISFARDICMLLSFVLSNNVTFNNYEFTNASDEKMRFYDRKFVNIGSGDRYLSLDNISNFLPIMLRNLLNMSEKHKKCFETIISYLNSIGHKYLEDLILSIAQVWEILADSFIAEIVTNNEQIENLKKLLKKQIADWDKCNTIKKYDLNFIYQRVLNSLGWETLVKKLETLSNQEKINIEKIGINFKELIKIRNQIAHGGRFHNPNKAQEYFAVFQSAQLGVYILLLCKLKYDGSIIIDSNLRPEKHNLKEYIKL